MFKIALPQVIQTQTKPSISNDTTRQSVLFTELAQRPVTVAFDQPDSSSDGGAVLLKGQCDQTHGLSAALAACLSDTRHPDRISHTLHDLLRQRLYGLACGYEDCNYARRLKEDPVQKLLLDHDPVSGQGIASQPTLSRFENAVGSRELLRMSYALADSLLGRHRKRLKRKTRCITLDMDPTDDQCHGQQQLSFFNSHYHGWCFLPMACLVTFDNESEQYLLAHVLRPGDTHASTGAISIMKRLLNRIRHHFPDVRIRVRLDRGFGNDTILSFMEEQQVDYVVGFTGNNVLQEIVAPALNKVQWLSYRSGCSETLIGECQYEAGSWSDERRIVYNCEVVRLGERDAKDNCRFVVTNLRHIPATVYEKIYCQRALVENRIKEMQQGAAIDRTSCTRFFANQLRVIVSAAAYALMQELRLQAKGTCCENARVETLRLRLLKMGVWFKRSVRRLIMHLPDSAPWRMEWCQIAKRLGGVPI